MSSPSDLADRVFDHGVRRHRLLRACGAEKGAHQNAIARGRFGRYRRSVPVDYSSSDDDNGRWLGFKHRPDDIVISTRSKTGTTWVQMICALLVFQRPKLPGRLVALSPWLDRRTVPRDVVWEELAAQRHRRFIKTHTPLDGLPLAAGVTYIVTGRHPLDTAVSLYHHSANIDRARLSALTGRPSEGIPDGMSLRDWLRWWIAQDVTPCESLDSLPGIVHHVTDAWQTDQRVVMVHYDDLLADLDGEMRRLADALGIEIAADLWPELVAAARFERMAARSDDLVPDSQGVLKDKGRFFRGGRSGEGLALLTSEDRAHYETRVDRLAVVDDVRRWLHGGRRAVGSTR